MNHEVTIISDDIRIEFGNKVSLMGIYDDSIVLRSLPARILKLGFYQRWIDFFDVKKVQIGIRGPALGDGNFTIEARPSQPLKPSGIARIMIVVGPLDVLKEGAIHFQTTINDEPEPRYTHQMAIRNDPNLKIE